jgi:hypothetical protein
MGPEARAMVKKYHAFKLWARTAKPRPIKPIEEPAGSNTSHDILDEPQFDFEPIVISKIEKQDLITYLESIVGPKRLRPGRC